MSYLLVSLTIYPDVCELLPLAMLSAV